MPEPIGDSMIDESITPSAETVKEETSLISAILEQNKILQQQIAESQKANQQMFAAMQQQAQKQTVTAANPVAEKLTPPEDVAFEIIKKKLLGE